MKLKQCPFCGGELEEFTYGYFINHKNGCFLGTKRYRIRSIRKFNSRGKKTTYDIRKWNTRVERTCQRVFYKPTGVLVCSECGAGMTKALDRYCFLHYCPNCGAKVVES